MKAENPIEEVWRIRDELSAEYGYDVHRIFAALREDATRSAAAVAHDFELRNALSRHASATPLDEAERQYVAELLPSHDANEGIASFLERRKPAWEDR